MSPETIDDDSFENQQALVKLTDKCRGKAWEARLPLINSSTLFSAEDKKGLVSLGKQISTDNLITVFDQIDERGLKLSLPAVQFLGRSLHYIPKSFPIVERRRVAEAKGYYLELRRLEGGRVEREIGLLNNNIPLISGLFEGERLKLSSVTVLSKRLLSPLTREPLRVTKTRLDQLHSTAALAASNLAPSPTRDAGFVELANLLKKIQCLTGRRYENLVEEKSPGPENGRVALVMSNTRRKCTVNGCTGWPDLGYKSCCDAHDEAYCKGGDEEDRLKCDKAFYKCLLKHTNALNAWLMYTAVREWGVDHFNFYSSDIVDPLPPTTPNPKKLRVRVKLLSIEYKGDDIGNDTTMKMKITGTRKDDDDKDHKPEKTIDEYSTKKDLSHNKTLSVNKEIFNKTFDGLEPLVNLKVKATVHESDVGPDDENYRVMIHTGALEGNKSWETKLTVPVSDWFSTAKFTFHYKVTIQNV